MDEKFPYGYNVNAYINKAFEQMKEDLFGELPDTETSIGRLFHQCHGRQSLGGRFKNILHSIVLFQAAMGGVS